MSTTRGSRPMRRYLFHVRYTHDGNIEPLEVIAYDSVGAINSLPDRVVFWDFAQFDDGRYSQPADDIEAAA